MSPSLFEALFNTAERAVRRAISCIRREPRSIGDIMSSLTSTLKNLEVAADGHRDECIKFDALMQEYDRKADAAENEAVRAERIAAKLQKLLA